MVMAFRYMPPEKLPPSITVERESKQLGATDERSFQTDACYCVIGDARDVGGDGRGERQDSARNIGAGANHRHAEQRDGEPTLREK